MRQLVTINKYLSRQVRRNLCSVLANTQNPQQVNSLLSDLLSAEEFDRIAKRLAVAQFLNKSRSYADIKANLQVSPTEIAKVAKNVDGQGYQFAINDIKAELWADNWSRRLARLLKPLFSR